MASSQVGDGVGVGDVPKTVLRLKRRMDDSPASVLVMSYKKSKVETGDEPEEISKVFHLAGTVDNDKGDDVCIAKTIKEALEVADQSRGLESGRRRIKARRSCKEREPGVRQRVKEEAKKSLGDNRFRVVSQRRGLVADVPVCDSPVENEFLLNILDLVADERVVPQKKIRVSDPPEAGAVTVNGVPMIKESNPQPQAGSSRSAGDGFVFDLYVANDNIEEDHLHNQFVSVRPADYDYEFDFGDPDPEDEIQVDDDDDSNDEGNWRNDYPDSDPDYDGEGYAYGYDGDDEDQEFISHFAGVKLKDDLSSDDDNEYLYATDDDGLAGMYSHYKARLRREELADEVVSSESESE